MTTHPAPATTNSTHDQADPVLLMPVRSLKLGGLIGVKVPAMCSEYISPHESATAVSPRPALLPAPPAEMPIDNVESDEVCRLYDHLADFIRDGLPGPTTTRAPARSLRAGGRPKDAITASAALS